jgi:hypothetical protein
MLGIVLKFGDVKEPIRCPQKLCLRSTSKPPDMLDGVDMAGIQGASLFYGGKTETEVAQKCWWSTDESRWFGGRKKLDSAGCFITG